MAAASDPANLPPAGTAPAPVMVDKQLDVIWSTPIKTLKGEPTTLAAYKGKAIMLVNVASKCGNTPQYSTLEALQKKYAAKGFTVIGFPCNQFGGQEPGTAEEIQTFCATNYGITFRSWRRSTSTRDPPPDLQGADADRRRRGQERRHPLELREVRGLGDGKKVTRFSPKVKPEDPTVIAAVEAALPK